MLNYYSYLNKTTNKRKYGGHSVLAYALDESEKTLERITTIEESDISDIMVKKQNGGRRIGFFCE